MSLLTVRAKGHAVSNVLIALACPIIAILVFRAGIRMHFTNNRVFDTLVTLPLFVGGYFGITAFRSRDAHIMTRLLGLLAAIICVPYAVFMLFVTIFGLT